MPWERRIVSWEARLLHVLTPERLWRLPAVWRYGMAVLIGVAAATLRGALVPWLGTVTPYSLSLLAVASTTLAFGIGPGLLCMLLGDVAVEIIVMKSFPTMFGTATLVRLGAALAVGVIVCFILHVIRVAQIRTRASEARLAAFSGATFEGIIESEGGQIVDCNEQIGRLVGCTVAELKGTAITDLIPLEDRERVQANIRENRESVTEHAMLRKDGTRLTVEAHGHPSLPGSSTRYTAIRDVTERKRAEEMLRQTLQRLEMLVASMYGGVLLLGDDGVALANQTFCDYFGLKESPANLIGLKPDEIFERIRPAYLRPNEEVSHIQDIVRGGEPVVGEEVAMRGGRTFLRDFIPVSVDGKLCGRFWYHVDITDRKRTEEALRASEEQLRELSQRLTYHVDNSPLAVIEWGPDMRLTRWSGEAERIFGWRAEEVLGKRMEDFRWIYTEDEPQVNEVSAELRTGTNPRRFSANRNYCKDGSVVYCEWHNSSMVDASGQLRSILSLVLDVTERTRAEQALCESEARLAQLIDMAPAFMCVLHEPQPVRSRGPIGKPDQQPSDVGPISLIGPRLVFELANDHYYQLVGRRDLIGKELLDALPELVDQPFPQLLENVFRSGEPYQSGESSVRLARGPDGMLEERWVDFVYLPLHGEDGSVTGIFVHGVDITGRKQAEENLKKLVDNLARSNRDLQQFAYVASHDLQEPLRQVSAFVHLLDQQYRDELNETARQYMGFVAEGTGRMQALVRDLLSYSRVDSAGQKLAPVSVESAIEQARHNLQMSIEENGASVTWDKMPEVNADPGQLTQLFQNLIGNALKFRAEAPPDIHVGVARKHNEWEFSVRDNGIGFDQQHADKIFQLFQRLHNRENYPGTGIGLTICKRVVERHGGRIWAESEPGKGAVFFFTLPGTFSKAKDTKDTKDPNDVKDANSE